MIGELRVERAQEVVTVERVMVPGILAVERDEYGVLAIHVDVGQARQLVNQVVGRVIAVPGRVCEADAIGQLIVAEKTIKRSAGEAVGTIRRPAAPAAAIAAGISQACRAAPPPRSRPTRSRALARVSGSRR